MPHQLQHFVRNHHVTEMNEMYASVSFRAFAMGLIGLFLPIYLFDIGFGIASIALFFIVSIITRILFEIPSALIVTRIGPKHMLALSYVMTAIFVGGVYFIDVLPELFYPIAALGGINAGLFWFAYHLELSMIKNTDHASSEMSAMMIFIKIASALGPVVGGVIATRADVGYTFLLATIALVIAVTPLFMTKDTSNLKVFKLKHLHFSGARKDQIAQIGINIQDQAAAFVWPLFIFLFLDTYEKTGLVVSIALVAGLIVARVVGQLGDGGKNKQILKLGSLITAAVHVMRSFISGFGSALFVNVINDLSYMMINTPFFTLYYQHSDHHKRVNYFINMQIAGNIGKLLLWITIYIGAQFYDVKGALITGFFAAAFGSMLMPLITGSRYRGLFSFGLFDKE